MSSVFKSISGASAERKWELDASSLPSTGRRFAGHGSASVGFSPLSLLLAILGGLMTGGAIAGYLKANTLATTGFELQSVPVEDLDSASHSLVPQDAAAMVDDAKSCRQPLAYLTFRPTGNTRGTIRFHSGPYHSPIIRTGVGVSRIALPFPSPYAAGTGQIEIENTSAGVDVFFRPGLHVDATQPRSIVKVHWKTDKPC